MRFTPVLARPEGSAPRLHRRIRAGLASALVGAVALTGVALAAPAQAAPLAPTMKVVAGDRTVTAAWSAVPGATSYVVKYSKKKSLSHAKTVRTAKRSLKLPKLKNGTPYFFAVTAVGTPLNAPALPGRSKVVKAVAASGVPFEVSKVSATPGPLPHQVTVTWAGGGRANKVAVVAGSSVVTNERSFHSAWYPATTRSITITVPAQYRSYIGAGSGNPVWVKVVQSNSSSKSFGPSYSYARKYRPSPVGTWAFAKGPSGSGAYDRITVAELNTQSVGATEGYSRTNQWAQRLPRLAKYIETTSPAPAVLTTAELATNVLDGCANSLKEPYRCASHTQVASLAAQLDRLKLVDTDSYDRVLDRMRAAPSWNAKVTNGAHVFVDPSVVSVVDWGYYSPAMSPSDHSIARVEGLGVSPWNPSSSVGPDRWATWARLKVKASGREFYTVAAHFPLGNSSLVVDAKAQLASKLIARIEDRANGLPIVFGGDVNSDATRSAKAVQPTFLRAGWMDAAAVEDKRLRTGMKVSTANGSGKQDEGADSGYGSKPIYHPYETSRIDYILLKNSPFTFGYANVLRLNADGTFRKDLQGTDHNMQLAQIGIGDGAR